MATFNEGGCGHLKDSEVQIAFSEIQQHSSCFTCHGIPCNYFSVTSDKENLCTYYKGTSLVP